MRFAVDYFSKNFKWIYKIVKQRFNDAVKPNSEDSGSLRIVAPNVYIIALTVGNILDPSYSQVGKTVSELIAQGAPNRDLLNAIFILYNLLTIPFASECTMVCGRVGREK